MTSTNPRTVAHYIESTTFGGCEEIVFLTVSGLDRSRWRPIVIHPASDGLHDLIVKLDRAGIERCQVHPSDRNSRLSTARHTYAAISSIGADVFHAHLNWSLGCRYGVIAAKLSGIKAVVATLHLATPLSNLRFGSWKRAMQRSAIDMHIGVADGVCDHIVTELGVDRRRTRTIHNGVEVDRFSRSPPAGLRQSISPRADRPLALTVARLHEQKGLEYLMQAAARCPDVIFAIAGEGPQRQLLEQMRLQLGLEDRVVLLGHRTDIPELLAACDLFVLPSINEGLPVSVLEAMASGKPVVATDIPGTREAVVSGRTGILVPPRDADAVASAISSIVRDQGLAMRMGEAGRSQVIDNFSVATMIDQVDRLYQELLTPGR